MPRLCSHCGDREGPQHAAAVSLPAGDCDRRRQPAASAVRSGGDKGACARKSWTEWQRNWRSGTKAHRTRSIQAQGRRGQRRTRLAQRAASDIRRRRVAAARNCGLHRSRRAQARACRGRGDRRGVEGDKSGPGAQAAREGEGSSPAAQAQQIASPRLRRAGEGPYRATGRRRGDRRRTRSGEDGVPCGPRRRGERTGPRGCGSRGCDGGALIPPSSPSEEPSAASSDCCALSDRNGSHSISAARGIFAAATMKSSSQGDISVDATTPLWAPVDVASGRGRPASHRPCRLPRFW